MKNNKNYIDNITPVLEQLTNTEIVKGMRSAIVSVKNRTVREVKSAYRGTGIKHNTKSKYGDPIEGIRGKVQKDKVTTNFTIMPIKKYSGAFILRWIEKGTSKRTNDKGFNRGTMKRKPFFMNTIERLQSQIKDMYEEAFIKSINRIIKKKRKLNG